MIWKKKNILISKCCMLKERYVDTYKEYTIEKTVLDNLKIEIGKILNDYIDSRRRVNHIVEQ